MLGKFLIWVFLVFWFWPNVLGLFSQPGDGWWRLFVFIGWGATIAFVPFAITMSSLDSVINSYRRGGK